MTYLALFVAGAFLCNSIPHLVCGLQGMGKSQSNWIWTLAVAVALLQFGPTCRAGAGNNAAGATHPPTKQQPPDPAAQSEAQKRVTEVFQSEIAAARTNPQRVDVARKLLGAGIDSASDPASCFVLLSAARRLAAEGGSADYAFQAIDELDRRFVIDAGTMRAETAARLESALRLPAEKAALVARLLRMVDDASGRDNYAEARQVVEAAVEAARHSSSPPLLAQTTGRRDDVLAMSAAFETSAKAAVVLAVSPSDPAANLAVGRFRCFFKGDWKAGLPLLKIGADPVLKSQAQADLDASGNSAPDIQIAIADGWWDIGQKLAGLPQRQVLLRAAHWYSAAAPRLKGLMAQKATVRTSQALADANLDRLPASNVSATPLDSRAAILKKAVLYLNSDRDNFQKEGSRLLALDLSANHNNAIIRGGTTTLGVLGDAMRFTVDETITTIKPIGIRGRSPRTTALFVRELPDPNNRREWRIGWGGPHPGSNFFVETHDDAYAVHAFGKLDWIVSAHATAGAWHHVAATYDGERVLFYIDGAKVGAGANRAYKTSDTVVTITGRNVEFDDVAIFDRALTPEEIKQLADAVIKP
jgi:hypothetical protein